MMKLISFSGLDGSGKSTQLTLVQKYLESQNRKVFYFHAVNFGLANVFVKSAKKLFYPTLRLKNDPKPKSIVKSNKFGILLRKIFLKIDILRFKKLISKLEKQGIEYLLSDRYFYDNLINIFYLTGEKKAAILAQELSCLKIPKPDLSFYLKAEPQVIMSRKKALDQGIDYLNQKKNLYEEAANILEMETIDGNFPPEIVFEEIKKIICQKFS